jgi:hypothetical protein
VGASGPLQNNRGFRGAPSHKQGTHHIKIVTMAGERIEPHRSFDPRYGSFRIAEERQVDATLHDQSRIIRIERKRTFQVVFALRKSTV